MNSLDLQYWIVDGRFLDSSGDEEDLIQDQKSFFSRCIAVCEDRERKYHGLWQQYGYRGCLGHLESKVARIRRAVDNGTIEHDVDDIIDLANYTGFMGRLVAWGMRAPGNQDENEYFFDQVREAAQDPVKRARMLEMLGVNGGVQR